VGAGVSSRALPPTLPAGATTAAAQVLLLHTEDIQVRGGAGRGGLARHNEGLVSIW
jgi:hypothetical protein